jgi:Tfp pilus assembly protein PilV
LLRSNKLASFLRYNGFTLLEVLLATFILSFALLSIVALSASTFARNLEADFNSQSVTWLSNALELSYISTLDDVFSPWQEAIVSTLPKAQALHKCTKRHCQFTICWQLHQAVAHCSKLEVGA